MNAIGLLPSKGCHVNFAHNPLHSYFDECQKTEIHLHFIFRSILYIIWEVVK